MSGLNEPCLQRTLFPERGKLRALQSRKKRLGAIGPGRGLEPIPRHRSGLVSCALHEFRVRFGLISSRDPNSHPCLLARCQLASPSLVKGVSSDHCSVLCELSKHTSVPLGGAARVRLSRVSGSFFHTNVVTCRSVAAARALPAANVSTGHTGYCACGLPGRRQGHEPCGRGTSQYVFAHRGGGFRVP